MSTTFTTHETESIASDLRRERLALENSVVEFETGPVGTVAKITRHDGRRDYAGPLPSGTIAALREVGE
jgi:hypothetical protein